MLVDLSIHSFVLIDRLDLSPVDGFTALTGETGAGKSIILDALAVALGSTAERRMIKAGAERASVSAAFSLPLDHGVWTALDDADLDVDREEPLTLKRVIPLKGAIRAYINDQPVSAARLRDIGEHLVEIHGQHAAMGLLKGAAHRSLLDQYARNQELLSDCAIAWSAFVEARSAREALEEAFAEAHTRSAALDEDIAALDDVSATSGEAEKLANERAVLSHGQRLRDGLGEAAKALDDSESRQSVALAARAVERLCRLPGLDSRETTMGTQLNVLRESLERALIEMDETDGLLSNLLSTVECDEGRLEAIEARLFAIRGLARRFGVPTDELETLRNALAEQRAALDAGEDAIRDAIQKETEGKARWRTCAERLTKAREAAGARLESAVKRELKPLKMASATVRLSITRSPDTSAGALGQDQVSIEVETSDGGGFGPLAKIASGGELARISLALRCALADVGEAPVLVFDEADQGVGGAVAAAIGSRLARLGQGRQVFAVTHSPQVAAAGNAQWRIEKAGGQSGAGRTRIAQLDDDARLEEVARMLSGHTVTREARQAAARLLEGSCQRPNP